MASRCNAPMGLWDHHSNAALAACKEIERLQSLAKELSNALLTVAPLGGSECFIKSGEDFYADPEWFKVRIRELHDRAHEGMKRAVLAERQASSVK